MNHSDLIKRALTLTWRYKVLWIFGILLALTSGGGGSGGNGNVIFNGGDRGGGRVPLWPGLGHFDPSVWIGIGVTCCCLLLIWIIVAVIVQYVARAALYRGVDQIESTGTAPTWQEGFRLGWSNRTFRLWLLDLIIGIPFALIAILLLVMGASPLLLLLAHNGMLTALGIAFTIGLELLIILVLIVAGVILGVLGQFWAREITLADQGIGQAIVSGYQLVRAQVKDVGIMWLLLVAIGLGFGLIMVPVAIAVIAVAAAVGAGLGFSIYAATQSIGWALLAGLPPFLLITIVPLTLIQGVYLTFQSGAWTLTYREVALEARAVG